MLWLKRQEKSVRRLIKFCTNAICEEHNINCLWKIFNIAKVCTNISYYKMEHLSDTIEHLSYEKALKSIFQNKLHRLFRYQQYRHEDQANKKNIWDTTKETTGLKETTLGLCNVRKAYSIYEQISLFDHHLHSRNFYFVEYIEAKTYEVMNKTTCYMHFI